jgi:hypothetical protein
MLSDLFERSHANQTQRHNVPPILVFRTAGSYRDVQFLGLAVPGATGMPATEDLVAIWRSIAGQRFQNYRAIFTILNTPRIGRAWLDEVSNGTFETESAPKEWTEWLVGGQPTPLRAPPELRYRSKSEQLPASGADRRIVKAIYERFRDDPHEFEECAVQIAEMLLPSIVERDLTRRSRDGGRDAIGKYRIGSGTNGIKVNFALEAKCYGFENPVGVKDTSRLISRLRHRQFGILVTTSYLHVQAYKEITEDEHPILVISGRDIASILKTANIHDEKAVADWLDARFSERATRRR